MKLSDTARPGFRETYLRPAEDLSASFSVLIQPIAQECKRQQAVKRLIRLWLWDIGEQVYFSSDRKLC